jgi:hypothetical protein
MSNDRTTIREATKAIVVGEEIGMGAVVTAGTKDRVIKNADNNFKKGVDMIFQGGLSRGGSFRGRGSGQPGNYQHTFSNSSNGRRAGERGSGIALALHTHCPQ